jgi:hypothetical protein
MMDSLERPVAAVDSIYELGRVAFTVKTPDAAFERELTRLFARPRARPASVQALTLVESDVRAVIRQVLTFHRDCRWIHAACLRSPEGRTVLIAGLSGAGKSTTAAALALGFGWKVLSDDLTLIDPATDAVVLFATPLSLKGAAPALLHQAVGVTPGPLLRGEWIRIDDLYATAPCPAQFDVLVHLRRGNGHPGFQHTPCSPAEYTRLLLPSSSVLRDAGGPERFAASVASGLCHRMTDGTLSERVNLIVELNERAR